MKLYRIYTEDKNRAAIKAACDVALPGYTIISAIGLWHGVEESSLIIEYIDFGDLLLGHQRDIQEVIDTLALDIKAVNNQEAVLVTVQDVQARMLR